VRDLRRFLTVFWSAVISLAGLVGLYLSAEAVNRTRLFWYVISLGVIVGCTPLATRLIRRLAELVKKGKDYDRVLQQLAVQQTALEERNENVKELESQATKQFAAGVLEGQKQIIGAEITTQIGEMPKLIALAQDRGRAVLVARHNEPDGVPLGARFLVEVQGTGSIKGAVEVILDEGEIIRLFVMKRGARCC
jgi:hypothetical protein